MTTQSLDDIVAKTEAIADSIAEPAAHEVDHSASWPEATVRALQKEGLGGLVVPLPHGGLGHGLLATVRTSESLGRRCASSALCFAMHNVGSAVIAAKATSHQAENYLAAISAGEHLTTLALSEPGTGAHFYFPETRMSRDDGGFVIGGTKSFVTNGAHADSYVLSTVAHAANTPPGHFSCVLVGDNAEGLEWGPPWDGIGMRGNSSRNLTLNDVWIPHEDLLGEEGDQIWYIFHVVAPFFLVAMAGTYLGIAQRALDEATKHLGGRIHSHSGSTLREHDVLQHRLGTLWATVQHTRRLIYWAAEEGDRGGAEAIPALLAAKAEVAHTAVDTVNDCMTLMGGISYRKPSIMERLMRDARAAHVMAPTTDILYTWTGRALLDLPLLST